MFSVEEMTAADKLIVALSDRRATPHGIAERIATSSLISQEIVFDFVKEYIKYYAFVQDSGAFPNGNMNIAKTLYDAKLALDEQGIL
jgi:hypothetical protein